MFTLAKIPKSVWALHLQLFTQHHEIFHYLRDFTIASGHVETLSSPIRHHSQ